MVFFAKYRLFYRALLQKRHTISSILPAKATPYVFSSTCISCFLSCAHCVSITVLRVFCQQSSRAPRVLCVPINVYASMRLMRCYVSINVLCIMCISLAKPIAKCVGRSLLQNIVSFIGLFCKRDI